MMWKLECVDCECSRWQQCYNNNNIGSFSSGSLVTWKVATKPQQTQHSTVIQDNMHCHFNPIHLGLYNSPFVVSCWRSHLLNTSLIWISIFAFFPLRKS